MGERTNNIANLFSNMRTRNIILVTGGVLVLAIFIGYLGFSRKETREGIQTGATAARAPRQVRPIPGRLESAKFAKMQDQLNEQRQQEALQKGESFIPTITRTEGQDVDGIFSEQASQAEEEASLTDAATTSSSGEDDTQLTGAQRRLKAAKQALVDQQKTLEAQRRKQQEERLQQVQATQQQFISEEQVKQQQVQSKAMARQARALLSAWNATPAQTLVQGNLATGEGSGQGADGVGSSANGKTTGDLNGDDERPPIIKAGDIIFAVLNTAVDSDEPGPVLATVVTGKYKEAKLVGTLQKTASLPGTNGPTKVILKFTTFSIPEHRHSISINAVAIDPDTARTALASNVDHHYLLRYGSLFASSFIEGYGAAVTQAGTVTQNADGSSVTTRQQLDPREEIAAGLGTVGRRWGEQIGSQFNRPNTITVDSGTGVGILFTNDVKLNEPVVKQANPLDDFRRQAVQANQQKSSSITGETQ